MRRNYHFRRSNMHDSGTQELINELGAMRTALADAYMRFDTTTEPELVDACVYEINAAQSRCNYLLRVIKDAGGSIPYDELTGKEGAVWA